MTPTGRGRYPSGMFGQVGMETLTPVTLYTDSYVARGSVRTRQHRLSDVLNGAEHAFLVLEDVTIDEFGSRAMIERAPFAQINLETVLFGVADTPVQPMPELRTIKVPEQALIVVPPFRITGRIHLVAEYDLRTGLHELVGRFIPITEATFWSDRLGEPRTHAQMLAVNHSRAHIFAPYEEHDVWAGLPGATEEAVAPSPGAAPGSAPEEGSAPGASAWPAADLAGRSGGEAGSGAEAGPVSEATVSNDPWRDLPR